MGDLSFHFDATYRWDYAQQIIASPAIRSAFLMNTNPAQVRFALQHTDFVVVRVFDPFNEYAGGNNPDFEKKILDLHAPQEFVSKLDQLGFAEFKNNPKVRFVVGWNELYGKRGNDLRTQNLKMTAVGLAMVQAGYGVGLGGYAADKSFYMDDVAAGHWDSLINLAVQYPTRVSFDVHEYDVITPFAGHLKFYPDGFPDTLKTAFTIDPNNIGAIPYRKSEGAIENNYKIGRIALLIERSYQRHGKSFYWYRGECAHDFKDDGALKQFIDEWYKPQFGHPSGINSLLPYYNHVLGGISGEQYDELIAGQYVALEKQDPPECQANFIFAHNGTIEWIPFNTATRPYFVQLIANHREETDVIDPTFEFSALNFTRYAVSTTTGGKVRVRDTYGLNSTVLDAFFRPTPQDVLMVHPSEQIEDYPPVRDGHTWVYFVFPNGVTGWSAFNLLDETLVELPPPPDEPDYKAMIEAIREIISY